MTVVSASLADGSAAVEAALETDAASILARTTPDHRSGTLPRRG
jgi:hypothetical protein